MGRRTDTRTSPLQGRDRLAPSQMTRLGNGFRTDGIMLPPESETDGVPVIDWGSVHLITYADSAAYHDLVAIVRPWRYYSKQRDGQSGVGSEVGRWVPDFHVTVALDPDRIDHAISSQYAWETRDAEKMFWQVIAVQDSAGNAPATMPWIIMQPFGYTHKDDPFGVSVSTASGGGGGVGPDCCPPEFTRMAAVKATHWSPNDGTVVFASGTTLTASLFPFTVADASCFISGIAVRKVSGEVVEYINGHNGVSISAAANVITIVAPGTPFAATDLNYYVYIVYQDKAENFPVVWQLQPTHWSPKNGSSTRLAATQLTTAGFPFVVDDVNCTVLGVIVRRGSGAIEEFINGHDGATLSATGDVVTLAGAGASPFLGTDSDVYIYLLYEEKAYTEATDSYRSEEIAPLNGKYTQPAYIVNDQAVIADPGTTYAPSADGIVMDGYKDIQFQMHLLGGIHDDDSNCTVTVTFQGSNDAESPAGTRLWVDLAVGYDLGSDSTQASWTSVGATPTEAQVDFDNWMGKRIRAVYDWDKDPNHAGGEGMVVITERRKAL